MKEGIVVLLAIVNMYGCSAGPGTDRTEEPSPPDSPFRPVQPVLPEQPEQGAGDVESDVKEDMKYCETEDDCVAVGCSCLCSGCGGFAYDDIVNKKFEEAWYEENKCNKPEICLMVCCPAGMTIVCEDNTCAVKIAGQQIAQPS